MNNKYSKYFSEKELWAKVKNVAKSAGIKVVYGVLLLFYTMQDENVTPKTKLIIAAALGYFILPADAIFDLTPIIGYSDDLGVLIFALTQISSNITNEVRIKARTKLHNWFGEINETELDELEAKF